jgi:signal transduction histidine kinase
MAKHMLKIMNKVFFLLFLLLPFVIVGQNTEDSYSEKIEKLKNDLSIANDTTKVDILNILFKELLSINPSESLKYVEEALQISKKESYKSGIARSLSNIGIAHRRLGDFDEAIVNHKKSIDLYEEINDKYGKSKVLQSLAITYGYIGDYNEALESFLKAFILFEEVGDSIGIANSNNNIGMVYYFLENSEKALEFLLKGLKIRKQIGNKGEIAASYNNIGEVYTQLNNANLALVYYDSALNIYKGNGRKDLALALMVNIGNGYKKLECYTMAYKYYNQGLETALELKDKWGIVNVSKEIADIHLKEKDYKKSLKSYQYATNLAKEISALDLLVNCYLGLSNYYTEIKDYKKALNHHLLYVELRDSLFNEEKSKQIAEMQTKYETEKTEKENIILKEKELLNIEELKKQRITTISIGSISILLLILIVIIYRSSKVSKRKNKLLTEKNLLINEQKAELSANSENLRQANEEIRATNDDLEQQKEDLKVNIENLKQTQKQLIETAKMASLGQLTAGVAHELNNPINFVKGNVKPLKRDIEDVFEIINKYDLIIKNENLAEKFEEVETLKTKLDYTYVVKEINDLLEGINEGSSRTSEIVKGLRTFSRLEEEEFTKADIHEIIDSTLSILQNKIKSRINIKKDYKDIGLIECLPSKLNQVFMNIINNGIEAINGEGEINIQTSKTDNQVRISISDTGSGIKDETMNHIFEPFFTTKDVGDGTGLGLSISLGIINNHNGDIDVISELAKGTKFIITIPINQPK